MDEAALERAKQRIAAAAEGRPARTDIAAALERSREQVATLAATAAELEASIPGQVGDAVRDGLRAEVLPVARHIAELRGLFNQAIRRLERIEGDLLAERNARVDDLALLVELVTSGWRGVDSRLARLESLQTEPLRTETTSQQALVESLPAQSAHAEAIAERAGAERAGTERGGVDRAEAA